MTLSTDHILNRFVARPAAHPAMESSVRFGSAVPTAQPAADSFELRFGAAATTQKAPPVLPTQELLDSLDFPLAVAHSAAQEHARAQGSTVVTSLDLLYGLITLAKQRVDGAFDAADDADGNTDAGIVAEALANAAEDTLSSLFSVNALDRVRDHHLSNFLGEVLETLDEVPAATYAKLPKAASAKPAAEKTGEAAEETQPPLPLDAKLHALLQRRGDSLQGVVNSLYAARNKKVSKRNRSESLYTAGGILINDMRQHVPSLASPTDRQLVASMPEPMQAAMKIARDKAIQTGFTEITPAHMIYGMLTLLDKNLPLVWEGKTDTPEGRNAEAIFKALFPAQYADQLSWAYVRDTVTALRHDFEGFCTNISDNKPVLNKKDVELAEPFKMMLEAAAQSDDPMGNTLQQLFDMFENGDVTLPAAQRLLALHDDGRVQYQAHVSPEDHPIQSSFYKAGALVAFLRYQLNEASGPIDKLTTQQLADVLEVHGNLAPAWLMGARVIAQKANAPAIEPMHMALAMLRIATLAVDNNPDILVAPPDRLSSRAASGDDDYDVDGDDDAGSSESDEEGSVSSRYHSSNSAVPSDIARITIDALIPSEYRTELTKDHVLKILRDAERDMERLVYANSGRIRDRETVPEPSPALRGILKDLLRKQGPEKPGEFPYALTDAMRTKLRRMKSDSAVATGAILGNMVDQARTKSGFIPTVTFDNVAGYESVKEQLQVFADGVSMGDELKRKYPDMKIPKGVLLEGPPGTGKTLMARAMANYMGLPFFYFNGTDFMSMWRGQSAARVRKAFAEARKHPKAFIFVDEIDGLLKARSASDSGGSNDEAVNAFLGEMDGFLSDPGTIVMGATNRKDILDPAAIREGRLETHIKVDNPEKKDRRLIFDMYTKDKPLADDVNPEWYVRLMQDRPGAAIESLVNQTTIRAERTHKQQLASLKEGEEAPELRITADDFDKTLDIMDMGPVVERERSRYDKMMTATHEVLGHALMAYIFDFPMRTISTVDRGDSLGHVSFIPLEGDKARDFEYQIRDLIMGVAGRMAEIHTSGRRAVTPGARGDYDMAREALEKLISHGLFVGHDSMNYAERGDAPSPNSEDRQLISYLLAMSRNAAQEMMKYYAEHDNGAAKHQEMLDFLTPGVEFRGVDQINAYFDGYVSPEVKAAMNQIADGYIDRIYDTLEKREAEKIRRFEDPVKYGLDGSGKDDEPRFGSAAKTQAAVVPITQKLSLFA